VLKPQLIAVQSNAFTSHKNMLTLNAKIRKDLGKKTKSKENTGKIPAVVYGHDVKNVNLEIDATEFTKVFSQTGESSLVSLNVEGEKAERPVLIHEIQKNSVTDKVIHIDFYQASLTEEVEVSVPLVFEGVSLAVKDLGGTLVKEAQELEVKSLPQNLPHDIKVDVSSLNTFEDEIKVKDLVLPPGVKVSKGPEEIIVKAVPPSKVEEELETPIEEKVEDVEKIEKEKKVKEEEVVEEPEK